MLGQTGEESSDLVDGRIAVRLETSTRETSAPEQIGLGEAGVLLKNGFQNTKPNLDGLGVTKQQVGGYLVVDRPETVELVEGDIEIVLPVACISKDLETWSLDIGLQCLDASFLSYSCIDKSSKVRHWCVLYTY